MYIYSSLIQKYYTPKHNKQFQSLEMKKTIFDVSLQNTGIIRLEAKFMKHE